jgi:hypothetical protein
MLWHVARHWRKSAAIPALKTRIDANEPLSDRFLITNKSYISSIDDRKEILMQLLYSALNVKS